MNPKFFMIFSAMRLFYWQLHLTSTSLIVIKRLQPNDHMVQILDLSMRAWAPVFDSIKASLDPAVYRAFYPAGWEIAQRAAVNATCLAPDVTTWVAVDEDTDSPGKAVGFTACKLHDDDSMGEIYMIAIDPDYQSRGIGKDLARYSLNWMKGQGMKIAMVETGADPGHAPARRLYESVGFRLCPVSRYFQAL